MRFITHSLALCTLLLPGFVLGQKTTYTLKYLHNSLSYHYELHKSASLETEAIQSDSPLILETRQQISMNQEDDRLKVHISNDPISWMHHHPAFDSLMDPYFLLKQEMFQQGDMNILAFGYSEKQYAFLAPLFIPLPPKPVILNETWEFNILVKTRGLRQSEIVYTGHCLLYEIKMYAGDTIATIIVTASTESKGKYNYKQYYKTDDLNFTILGTLTQIVYFNIDKGYVQQMISEQIHTFRVNSKTQSKEFNVNSKLVCKAQNALVTN